MNATAVERELPDELTAATVNWKLPGASAPKNVGADTVMSLLLSGAGKYFPRL